MSLLQRHSKSAKNPSGILYEELGSSTASAKNVSMVMCALALSDMTRQQKKKKKKCLCPFCIE